MYGKTEDGQQMKVVATFRLPAHVMSFLRKESRKKHLSINILMNNILQEYIEFHSSAIIAGMMPFPKRILSSMMDYLNNAEIKELAERMTRQEFVNLVYMKKNRYTMTNFIELLLVWAKHSGFPLHDIQEDNQRTLVIQHNMGRKWSAFMKLSLENTLEKLSDEEVTFEKPDDMLVITIGNDAKAVTNNDLVQ